MADRSTGQAFLDPLRSLTSPNIPVNDVTKRGWQEGRHHPDPDGPRAVEERRERSHRRPFTFPVRSGPGIIDHCRHVIASLTPGVPGPCAVERAARPRWCRPTRRPPGRWPAPIPGKEYGRCILRISVWPGPPDAAPARRSRPERTARDRCHGTRRDRASPCFRSGLGGAAGEPVCQSLGRT